MYIRTSVYWSWVNVKFEFNKIIILIENRIRCLWPLHGRVDGCLTWKFFSLLPRISYTGASALQSTVCSPRLAHPPCRHCERESVGPSGLPGPQLRLASIWPDRGNTSQLKNKSNNGRTEEDEVTATPIQTRISQTERSVSSTARIRRRLNSCDRRQTWSPRIFVSRL